MNLITWKESFNIAQAERTAIDTTKLCKYGVKPLDDALFCITNNELVVIGADSGAGKSEIALQIARTNAKRGKRVAMFFLEGGHQEAINRMVWRSSIKRYLKEKKTFSTITYTEWINNKVTDPEFNKIVQEEGDNYEKLYGDNFYICDIKKSFTVDDLIVALLGFHNLETEKPRLDIDLIVIDHLQYFSLAEGEMEIQSITRILREVKDMSNLYKIPIVLVSHLRKKTKDRGLPSQEDFYGSSNIPKIATTCITVSPIYKDADFSQGIYPTYFRIVKSRVGIPPSIVMKVNFNQNTLTYEQDYEVYRINYSSNQAEANPLKSFELPRWAK